MKRVTFYALLTLLALSTFAVGQSCNIRRISLPASNLYYFYGDHYYRYYGGNHGQLYYYEGGYYYPKETVVLVPKPIHVEVSRDHYYSIDVAMQQNLLVDAIVGRLLRMQQEKVQPGPTRPSPTGDPVVPAAQETKAGTYQNEALLKTVSNSCAKCHGPTSKNTKLLTSDGKLNDLPSGKVWECFGLVNSGEMPKGGKSLPDAEVKLFYDWAKNAKR